MFIVYSSSNNLNHIKIKQKDNEFKLILSKCARYDRTVKWFSFTHTGTMSSLRALFREICLGTVSLRSNIDTIMKLFDNLEKLDQ